MSEERKPIAYTFKKLREKYGDSFKGEVVSDIPEIQTAFPGTLRDWFAGQALAGMLSHFKSGCDCSLFAEDAYELADAMLKAREEK